LTTVNNSCLMVKNSKSYPTLEKFELKKKMFSERYLGSIWFLRITECRSKAGRFLWGEAEVSVVDHKVWIQVFSLRLLTVALIITWSFGDKKVRWWKNSNTEPNLWPNFPDYDYVCNFYCWAVSLVFQYCACQEILTAWTACVRLSY